MYADTHRFTVRPRFAGRGRRTSRTAAIALCASALLLAPQVAVAGPEFDCPGTRYIYTSSVGVPDPANTGTTCVYTYDGGTVASNGTSNTSTPFSLGSSIWTAITNAFGRLVQLINAAGTTFNLGPLPGKTESIGSPGVQTTYTYDAMYRVQSTSAPVSPSGVTTTYTYDATYTSQVQAADRNGNVTTYTYNTGTHPGQPDTVTPTGGSTVQYQYDSLNRPTKAEEQTPGGRVLQYTYDDGARTVERTDSMGTTTTYSYDGNQRVTQVIDAAGNATEYSYDPSGNLIEARETMPPGPPDPDRVFQYQYDVQGRVTELRDSYLDVNNPADDRYTCFQYDSSGRLTTYIEDTQTTCNSGRGLTTTFTYDALGQLASITDPQGAQAQATFVPAPGTLLLLGLGLGGLALRRRAQEIGK